MRSSLDRRGRVLAALGVFVGAPISAEYLQAYLTSTGNAREMVAGLLILAPLYGGAALLIREIAVRRGLGWTGILLLAAAFGLAMPGLVDLALFAEHRADVADWDQMRQPTLLAPLGISAYTTLTWVSGHILMSIGAPLAVLDGLAPQYRNRPLLGRWGIVALSVLWVLAATFIRSDGVRMYHYRPSVTQTVAVAAVVVLLVALTFTRIARPVVQGDRQPVRLVWIVLAGVVGKLVIDLTPANWAGVAVLALLLGAAAIAIRRYAITKRWSTSQIGALATGALIGATLIGFLAPIPPGVLPSAKLTQNALMVTATLAVAWLVVHRRPERQPCNQ